MTIRTNKPAINLREELASLRNQGGYSEQQFWMDGLMPYGKFDTGDLTGWDASGASESSVINNQLNLLKTTNVWGGVTSEYFPAVVGKTYVAKVDLIAHAGNTNRLLVAGSGVGTIATSGNITSASVGVVSLAFTATSTEIRLIVTTANASATDATYDNFSVFEVDASNDVIHTMPKGWKPKDVFEDGLLQREGSANDYEVIYDGFDYKIKPTVAPTATTETCVIGVKA